jgi:hypothetical protein
MTFSVQLCGGLQEETTKPRVSHNLFGARIDTFSSAPTEVGAEGSESDHGTVNKENNSSVSEDIRSSPVRSVRRQTSLHE